MMLPAPPLALLRPILDESTVDHMTAPAKYDSMDVQLFHLTARVLGKAKAPHR